MRLSQFFPPYSILSDADFVTLGPTVTEKVQTLAYCNTIHHLTKAMENHAVSCILTTKELAEKAIIDFSLKGFVIADSPREVFFRLHLQFIEEKRYDCGIRPFRGENVFIHPSAQISEVTSIGDNVTIRENVTIRDNVQIGSGVSIDAGAVIGCDGLLYLHGPPPVHIRHGGGVRIGDNVSILANAVIVRSIHDSFLTTVGDNSIIGIQTNIGHEAEIGSSCVLSSGCIVARGAQISPGTFMGPGSVIREYVVVGENASIKIGSVVIDEVPVNGAVSGSFAKEHTANMIEYASGRRKMRGRR